MSTNDGGHVIAILECSNEEEQAALDALGPLTRRAINDAPVRYSAAAVMAQVKAWEATHRMKFPAHVRDRYFLDPKNPALDASLAAGVMADSKEKIMLDRSEYEAELGVKVLEPRYSPKSIREQRRSARRFRGW